MDQFIEDEKQYQYKLNIIFVSLQTCIQKNYPVLINDPDFIDKLSFLLENFNRIKTEVSSAIIETSVMKIYFIRKFIFSLENSRDYLNLIDISSRIIAESNIDIREPLVASAKNIYERDYKKRRKLVVES
ncbi:MAG: hypothetical protein ABIM99_06145 [Candidatus Dojkabacteria bacterium]